MSKTSSHSSKSVKWCRHVYSSNRHYISWSSFPSVNSLSDDLHLSWYMSDGHLITWLLNLDFLEADELARLDLHNKLTLSLVSHALLRRAFHFGVEFSCVYNLIDFKTTDIASVNGHLNAWSHVTHTGYDTLASN